MKRNEILKIHGTEFTRMTKRLLEEADLAGLIRNKTQGLAALGCEKPDPCIGIKPNLVTPSPAMFGATTHPEVVEGIIQYLQEHGFTNLLICEGSWVGDKTSEAFEYCGYNTLAETYNVRLLDTQKDSSFSVTCPVSSRPDPLSGQSSVCPSPKSHGQAGQAPLRPVQTASSEMELHLCSCLKDIDFLINVPVLKGHCQTKMTCALKNMKGLIPNSEKRRFHSLGLHRPIAFLNTVIHQDFIVVDHICGDPDFEEGGNPMVTNCIMATLDPVLTDAYACQVLQYQPDEVEYIRLAAQAGVGSKDLKELKIRQVRTSGQPLPEEPAPEDLPVFLTHKALQLNYATQEIDSCSSCYSALTEALQRLHEEGLLRKLTDELHCTFHIGQGYRGCDPGSDSNSTSPDMRVGIGNCTRLFAKNIPGCPPTGDEIYQYLKQLLDR